MTSQQIQVSTDFSAIILNFINFYITKQDNSRDVDWQSFVSKINVFARFLGALISNSWCDIFILWLGAGGQINLPSYTQSLIQTKYCYGTTSKQNKTTWKSAENWLKFDSLSRNLKSFETHLILSKLEGFWVDGEHNLLHAVASRITFICPMSFNSFPMDVQVKTFEL